MSHIVSFSLSANRQNHKCPGWSFDPLYSSLYVAVMTCHFASSLWLVQLGLAKYFLLQYCIHPFVTQRVRPHCCNAVCVSSFSFMTHQLPPTPLAANSLMAVILATEAESRPGEPTEASKRAVPELNRSLCNSLSSQLGRLRRDNMSVSISCPRRVCSLPCG